MAIPRKIEYKVRPVTRYIVTRFETITHPGGAESGGSECKGEFNNLDVAYQVGYALCRDEHQRLGWALGDKRIKYPEQPTEPEAQVGI